MKIKKVSDLFRTLCNIRDKYFEDIENRSLAIVMLSVHIHGYLEALVDFGIITSEEQKKLEKEWVAK
jgi:hypothetical protein